jgi:hypothetical protein
MLAYDPFSFEQAYAQLCKEGEQFPFGRSLARLPGPTNQRPGERYAEVKADVNLLREAAYVYCRDHQFRWSLGEHGIRTRPFHEITRQLQRPLHKRAVWGFSGYATGGRPYDLEAQALLALYECLDDSGRLPVMTVDGAMSAGVLGLNGILASEYGVPSLGCTPYEGLASIGPRAHMLIEGATYQKREPIIAMLSDILACVGGDAASYRECQIALDHGSVVLLMVLRDYDSPQPLSKTHHTLKHTYDPSRLIVCNDLNLVPQCVDEALAALDKTDPLRFRTLRRQALQAIG